MKKSIKTLLAILLLLLTTTTSYCKSNAIFKPVKDTVVNKIAFSPEESFLMYKTILEEDSKLHREYIQELYSDFFKLISAIGAIALFIFYFILGRSQKEIRSQVDDKFKLKIDEIIQEHTSETEKIYKTKLNFFTNYIKHLIADVMSKAVIKEGDNPLPDINWENLIGKKILWVDDKPDNNKQHREVFKSFGIEFVNIKSTEEAKKLITTLSSYDLIISNMGRFSKATGKDNPEEGLAFLEFLNDAKIKTPRIIYTKPDNVKHYGDQVNKLGASITTGYTYLFKEIIRNLA